MLNICLRRKLEWPQSPLTLLSHLFDLGTMHIDCWVSVDKEQGNNTWLHGCVYTQSHSHYYMSTLLSGPCVGTVSLNCWASERELDSGTHCDWTIYPNHFRFLRWVLYTDLRWSILWVCRHFLPFGDWLLLKEVLAVCFVGTWDRGGSGGGVFFTVSEDGSQIMAWYW